MKLKFNSLAFVSVLLLLAFSLWVSAQETFLLTIDGLVFSADGTTLVPNGWNVDVTNNAQGLNQSSTTGDAGRGRYSVVFIALLGGIVGAVGDDIEVVVTDAGGNKSSLTYILTKEDIDAGRVTIDVFAPNQVDMPDANQDGVIDIWDLVLVGKHFGERSPTGADVNGDGLVDISDLAIVSKHFGDVTQPAQATNLVLVTRVIDGDTIELSDGTTIRYLGINTPENDASGGKEATEAKIQSLTLCGHVLRSFR